MEDIDQLLEDLRSATLNTNVSKKVTQLPPQSPNSQQFAYKRLNLNEHTNGNGTASRLSNQIINENELFDVRLSKNGTMTSDLDSLLFDLHDNSTAQVPLSKQESRKSIEKSIDTLDGDLKIKRTSNVKLQPETTQATKELEDLMSSLSNYKVDNSSSTTSTNRSSTVTNTSNSNLCNGCGEAITGQVITALGSLWHPAHFVCHFCNNTIGTSIFYEKDGRPYCENDYLNLFSPKCANCTQPILDQMLTALNKTWHPDCFTCLSCSKLLNDESFLERNNSAYCRDCYMTKIAPKCQHCSKAIIDNFISAMGSYWHENCFVCTECGIPFNTSSFFEYNNLPYCELHYHLKRGSLCSNCQQPINGRCITAMNKKFHPEHFICSFCTKQLSKGTFKEQNDKPYCHPCYFKLFPQ